MPAKTSSKKSGRQGAEMIYQIKITLVGTKPPIWRRLLVSDRTLLPDMHYMIQDVMGWENCHLHQFIYKAEYLGDPRMFDDVEVLDYRKIRIGTILKKPKDSLKYEYDFGDGWMHEIVLQKIHPKVDGDTYPFFIDGERNCPPEDCGGIYGFEHFVRVMADPDHEQHQELLEWHGEPYDPAHFDPMVVAQRFRCVNNGVYEFFSDN